jgi:hypothetical protein
MQSDRVRAGVNQNRMPHILFKRKDLTCITELSPGIRNRRKLVFQVPTTVTIKSTIFWNVTPCSLPEVYRKASILKSNSKPRKEQARSKQKTCIPKDSTQQKWYYIRKNGIAIPVTGHGGPYGCET